MHVLILDLHDLIATLAKGSIENLSSSSDFPLLL